MKEHVVQTSRSAAVVCLLALLAGISCGGGSAQSNSTTATHSVTLSWNASPSQVTGYYVYRGTQSGGPYSRLNAQPQPATTYSDMTVQAGMTYFYVTTSVDENLVESTNSNEAVASVPTS